MSQLIRETNSQEYSFWVDVMYFPTAEINIGLCSFLVCLCVCVYYCCSEAIRLCMKRKREKKATTMKVECERTVAPLFPDSLFWRFIRVEKLNLLFLSSEPNDACLQYLILEYANYAEFNYLDYIMSRCLKRQHPCFWTCFASSAAYEWTSIIIVCSEKKKLGKIWANEFM